MTSETELVRLVRRIAGEEAGIVGLAFSDGTVEVVSGSSCSVRKADPLASPTPGFVVPPSFTVEPGDHVWVYDQEGYKLVVAVLNRNAVLPAGLTLTDLVLGGSLKRSGSLTPPALATNVNDYAPDGGTAAYRWLQSLGGSNWSTSGFLAEADGVEHEWINSDATGIWTLKHRTTSVAANQITAPNYVDYALNPGAGVRGFYDGAIPGWRLIGK